MRYERQQGNNDNVYANILEQFTNVIFEFLTGMRALEYQMLFIKVALPNARPIDLKAKYANEQNFAANTTRKLGCEECCFLPFMLYRGNEGGMEYDHFPVNFES